MKQAITLSSQHLASRGFALVTTMILLAGCTILVVGYLSISRNEILSAKSYADAMRAEIAAAAGCEEARAHAHHHCP
jgi:type II secretory pathway component PulK